MLHDDRMPEDEVKMFIANRQQLTDNPLNTSWENYVYHMPNLDRLQDRSTKLFYDRLDPGNQDIWLYVVLFRVINYYPSLREVDTTQPFTEKFIRSYTSYIDFYSAQSLTMQSTTSYISWLYKTAGQRMLMNIFLPMLRDKKHIQGFMNIGRAQDMVSALLAHSGIGPVIATEIVKDLLYMRGQYDHWSAAPSTYHTQVSLNYLLGRDIHAYIPKNIFPEEIQKATVMCGVDFDQYTMGRALNMFGRIELENSGRLQMYLPGRAIKEERPSYRLFADVYNDLMKETTEPC
jgi:hypothetical protein